MRQKLPRPTVGQWVLLAVAVLVVVAVFADVLTTLPKTLVSGTGPPAAQLNGRLPGQPLVVGRPATIVLALVVTGGGTMSPACVAGNLTPLFEVVRTTMLGTSAGRWRDGESCAGILEPQATAPVVITVIPRYAGRYTLRLYPTVKGRRVGSGTTGVVVVRPRPPAAA